jgi:hypothetical protein
MNEKIIGVYPAEVFSGWKKGKDGSTGDEVMRVMGHDSALPITHHPSLLLRQLPEANRDPIMPKKTCIAASE